MTFKEMTIKNVLWIAENGIVPRVGRASRRFWEGYCPREVGGGRVATELKDSISHSDTLSCLPLAIDSSHSTCHIEEYIPVLESDSNEQLNHFWVQWKKRTASLKICGRQRWTMRCRDYVIQYSIWQACTFRDRQYEFGHLTASTSPIPVIVPAYLVSKSKIINWSQLLKEPPQNQKMSRTPFDQNSHIQETQITFSLLNLLIRTSSWSAFLLKQSF
jgi:hypothetical protein